MILTAMTDGCFYGRRNLCAYLLFYIALILASDFFLGSVLASTLTKLVMRYTEISDDPARVNALRAEVRGDDLVAVVITFLTKAVMMISHMFCLLGNVNNG